MSESIPKLLDISPTQGEDLDEKCAVEHFLGLDQTAAFVMISTSENPLFYFSDLTWMGDPALHFYIPSFIRYISSLDGNEQNNAVNEFLQCLRIRFSS